MANTRSLRVVVTNWRKVSTHEATNQSAFPCSSQKRRSPQAKTRFKSFSCGPWLSGSRRSSLGQPKCRRHFGINCRQTERSCETDEIVASLALCGMMCMSCWPILTFYTSPISRTDITLLFEFLTNLSGRDVDELMGMRRKISRPNQACIGLQCHISQCYYILIDTQSTMSLRTCSH